MPQIKSITFLEGDLSHDDMRKITDTIAAFNTAGFRFRDWHNPPGFIILEYVDEPFEEVVSKEFEYGYPTMDMDSGIVSGGKGAPWTTATPITDEQDASMPDAVLSSNS